jgi:multiple sugar transport system substrate-binding protein
VKTHVFMSFVVVLLALGVAAGGPTEAPPATQAPAAATEAPVATEAPAAETVSLRMWAHQNEAFVQGYDALIAAYEEANPNVDITLETFEYDLFIQTLQTAMPAGEEADIITLFGTWTAQYAERLAPLPESVIDLAEAEELFYAAPLGGYVVDGVLYGLPQEFNLEYGGVLINKTMYEAAGLTYPPQWASRDDVLTDAQALVQTDDAGVMTVAGYHFTSSDPAVFDFLAGIRQRGGDYWNADQTGFTFNTPEAKATLEWMLSAIEDWKVVDPVLFADEVNWVGDAFFEGRAALGYIGTWAIAEGRVGYPDFADEWDYTWLPSYQGDPVFVADSGWGLVVSPNSQHQDVAWDFVKFAATTPDLALQWNLASGTIPAMPVVAESDEIATEMPWVAAALDLLPYGSYLGNMPDRDLVVYEILYPHLLLAFQGVESADEALEAIDAEANATFE